MRIEIESQSTEPGPTEFTKLARTCIPPKEYFDNISLTDLSERPLTLESIVHTACNIIDRLTAENQKLNIILFHRENGLAHMDLNPEIMVSKIAELKAEIDRWKERYDNLDQRYNGYEVGNANLAEQIDRLTVENQKLNIILFHQKNNGQR